MNTGKVDGMHHKKPLLISLILLLLAVGAGLIYVVYPREQLPSPDKPYFLKLYDFRYYPDAVEAKNRIRNYPVFVMPMKTGLGVWFRVGVGPTSRESQAEVWQDKLAGEGITTEFEQYTDIKEAMVEKPGALIKENKAWVMNVESKPLPPVLRPIKRTIYNVPYSRKFKIIDCAISDTTYLRNNKEYHSFLKSFDTDDYSFSRYMQKKTVVEMFDKFVFVNYLDPVSKSVISFFAGSMSKRANIDTLINTIAGNSVAKTDIHINTGVQVLNGYSFEPRAGEIIYVLHNDESFVFADSDTDKQTLEHFLGTLGRTKGLIQYIPIRDQLISSIPVSREGAVFVYFIMNEIREDYVASKNYAEWAKRMKGYWNSTTLMHLNNGPLMINFFDLIGNDYTSKTYGLFSSEKRSALSNPWGRLLREIAQIYIVPVTIEGQKGWYLDRPDDAWGRIKEISFSSKHYIVAVDTFSISGHVLMRKDLESDADSLQVF